MKEYEDIANTAKLEAIQPLSAQGIFSWKKADFDTSIAAKEETVISVELAQIQRTFYRSVLDDKQASLMNSIDTVLVNFNNIMIEIRKIRNHPYLISALEPLCIGQYRSMKHLPDHPDPDPHPRSFLDHNRECKSRHRSVSVIKIEERVRTKK
jgi:chromodomain-helicase-DNA-binding protein 7